MPTDYERFRDESPENARALREAESELAVDQIAAASEAANTIDLATKKVTQLNARVQELKGERDEWHREAYNAHARINHQDEAIRRLRVELKERCEHYEGKLLALDTDQLKGAIDQLAAQGVVSQRLQDLEAERDRLLSRLRYSAGAATQREHNLQAEIARLREALRAIRTLAGEHTLVVMGDVTSGSWADIFERADRALTQPPSDGEEE